MMQKCISAAAVLTASLLVHAEDSPWMTLTQTGSTSFDIKADSLKISIAKNGGRYISLIARFVDKSGVNGYRFYEYQIDEAVCAKKIGQIRVLTTGGALVGMIDYVSAGGNVTSLTGDVLCGAMKSSGS